MDIRNKYKVVYIINQIFFDYFLENRKIIRKKNRSALAGTPTIDL